MNSYLLEKIQMDVMRAGVNDYLRLFVRYFADYAESKSFEHYAQRWRYHHPHLYCFNFFGNAEFIFLFPQQLLCFA